MFCRRNGQNLKAPVYLFVILCYWCSIKHLVHVFQEFISCCLPRGDTPLSPSKYLLSLVHHASQDHHCLLLFLLSIMANDLFSLLNTCPRFLVRRWPNSLLRKQMIIKGEKLRRKPNLSSLCQGKTPTLVGNSGDCTIHDICDVIHYPGGAWQLPLENVMRSCVCHCHTCVKHICIFVDN